MELNAAGMMPIERGAGGRAPKSATENHLRQSQNSTAPSGSRLIHIWDDNPPGRLWKSAASLDAMPVDLGKPWLFQLSTSWKNCMEDFFHSQRERFGDWSSGNSRFF